MPVTNLYLPLDPTSSMTWFVARGSKSLVRVGELSELAIEDLRKECEYRFVGASDMEKLDWLEDDPGRKEVIESLCCGGGVLDILHQVNTKGRNGDPSVAS